MKTALVLSAGGMFGAYEAGAWKALAGSFEPDLVVGASIGAVNGWAIAGGCAPSDLIERWRSLECAARYGWQWPRAWHGGVLDTTALREQLRSVYDAFRPRCEYALTLTDLKTFRPVVIRGENVRAEHLLATTAIICLFEQVRIGGKLYSDGGLVNALPLWAAAELGATHIVAINALPVLPGIIPRAFVHLVRLFAPQRSTAPLDVETLEIAPTTSLGSALDTILWKRENIDRWIDAGERDAAAHLASIEAFLHRAPVR